MTDSFGFTGESDRDPAQFANRIEPIKQDLLSTNDPEDLMLMIMDAINYTVTPIPQVGKFYTFVYNAKTPNITYDPPPLIACMELFPWGFRGLNFHWEKYRNYTWEELAGQLYIVEWQELDELLSLQYGKFLLNN